MQNYSNKMPRLASIAAIMIFSTASIATRPIANEVDPFYLALFRYLIPAACFAAIFAIRRKRIALERRLILPLLICGIGFFGLFPIAFNISLRTIEASRAVLFVSTIPFWSALIDRLFFGRQFLAYKKAGVLFIFAGMTVLEFDGFSRLNVGELSDRATADVLVIACAILATTNAIFSKTLTQQLGAMNTTFFTMLVGLAILLPASLIFGSLPEVGQFSSTTISLIAYLGFLPGCLGFLLRYYGISKLGPVHSALMPVFGAVFAVLLLHEKLSIYYLAALILIVAGSELVNRPARKA